MSTGTVGSTRSSYAILGCGSVGHAVAEELADSGHDVMILDRDESRVEALRDQDLDARVQNISDPDVADLVSDRDVVLVLASNVEANKQAVEAIRDRGGDQYIVVRASDPVSEDELRSLGADVVINPSTVISESALRSLEAGELRHKAKELEAIFDDTAGRMAILTRDSPEPDSIAAAVALRAIADHFGTEADIVYRGDIGHQENRAFVNLLGVDLRSLSEVDLGEYEIVALVDSIESDEPELDISIDVVIDHGEPDEEFDATFVDIRPNVSSTSTILTKYVQEFDISPSEPVATALLYGIRAETLDFKRDTTPADLTAAAYLQPFANHDTLEQAESPSMSAETLDVLAEAIQSREVQGSHLFSTAGFVRDPEALAQAAQHLLNLEGITTTTVFGIADDTIHIAARSKDIRIDIVSVLEDAFEDIGDASGHSTQANVEVPLGIFTGIETTDDNRETLLSLTEEAVRRKLFAAMGLDESGGDSNNGS